MRAFLTRAFVVGSALLMAASVSAQTQGLERVGPTSTVNGFPTWYQDKTGLALEFCQPLNQAELDGGWCLLLPGDTMVPETFPAPFSGEHFFWASDAAITSPTLNALLVLGLEAAFAGGQPVNGDQVVFGRIRVVFDAPVTGTYTVYHPYGVETIQGTAGVKVFFTEDVGILCTGAFDCALRGRIGPFLLPSATPGGSRIAGDHGTRAGEVVYRGPGPARAGDGKPRGPELLPDRGSRRQHAR